MKNSIVFILLHKEYFHFFCKHASFVKFDFFCYKPQSYQVYLLPYKSVKLVNLFVSAVLSFHRVPVMII